MQRALHLLSRGLAAGRPLGAETFHRQLAGRRIFISVFFRTALDQVQDLLRGSPYMRFIDHYQMSYHDWVGDKVAPFCTDRLFISPPWDSSIAPPSKLRITLDPGVVFGTGTHPTTRDSIEALEMTFQLQPVCSAHDLGTGTGILAVAASRLGCPLPWLSI